MKLKIGTIASSATSVAAGLITTFNNTLKFLFSSTNTNLYNYDGTEFESQAFASINDIEYDGTKYLASGNEGIILSSTDLTTWTTITSPTTKNINFIKYNNGLYFLGVDNA
jgi:hypothetical protein